MQVEVQYPFSFIKVDFSLTNNPMLRGTVELPGDKSISHRVAMLASLAEGPCTIRNFNTGQDCSTTLDCLKAVGLFVEDTKLVPPRDFLIPEQPLNCRNSASTMRMLTGLLAGKNIPCTMIGDVSLLQRPMGRVAVPLREMGAVIHLRDDEYAPLTIQEGVKVPIRYTSPVPSAQVKSAVLLAGIHLPGTQVYEPVPTRDHTEKLLEYLEVHRNRVVPAFEYDVPGDPSAAAFLVAAVLLSEGSDVTIRGLLMNRHRVAYLWKLKEAGASIEVSHRHLMQNELIADVRIRSRELSSPIRILPNEVPSLIDEIPILSLIGTTCGFEVSGAKELRWKESDRIHSMISNLDALGIHIEEMEDGYRIWPGAMGPGIVNTYGDHRIAMAFAAIGMEIDDPECVKISFPEFFSLLDALKSGNT